jgi:hypothetical protein
MRTGSILETVLSSEWVEVRARRRERRRAASLASSDRVEMDAVSSRRQSEKLKLEVHDVVRILPKLSRPTG